MRRLRPLLGLVGFLTCTVGAFVWWWNYSGSLFPRPARIENLAGTFESAAAVPVPRMESGGAVHGAGLYLVGGQGAFAQTLTSFLKYAPATDSWLTLPDLPEPINHPGVVVVEGRLYVVGGFGPIGIRPRGLMLARWDPRDTVYRFDMRTKTWSRAPPLPAPRGAGGVAVARNAIWYAGGIGESLLISADLFRFDLATETWARMPPMPTARDHLRMEALGGRLFAISGRQDDLRSNLAATERYDIDRGTWTRVADVEQARSGFGSAVLGGHIYIFGGEELWTCLAQIERYDPGRDRWEVLGEMPEARHGVVAGVIDGRIHLASGGTHPRVSISGIHRVYQPRPPAPSGARS